MPARVTQGMMSRQLIRDLNANMLRNSVYQNQLSTGRKINKPSDDPIGMTFSMRYRSELAATDQYQRNVDAAVSSLEYIDKTLSQAGDVLQRVRELVVQGATGTNPPTAMDAIRTEIKQLYDQLVNIGNSQFNGKYVFNGQMTGTPPYSTVSLDDTDPSKPKAYDSDPDTGQIKYPVAPGVQIPVNVSGRDVFGGASDPDNAFRILSDIYTALEQYDNVAVGNTLGRLDSRIDQLLRMHTEVGARSNRVELIQERLNDMSINLQNLQSKTEDADIAEVITNLKMGENVYQASLSVGARLITPSLVDFLK